jgi:DNA repair protein RadC
MTSLSIKNWSDDDKPREKLLAKGSSALSNAELIGILIGSGTSKKSAVDVAREILNLSTSLDDLGRLSISEFIKVPGIGEAKAVTIMAALELGRRRKEENLEKEIRITNSKSLYDYLYEYLVDLSHEEFYVVLIKRNLGIIKAIKISEGGVAGTVVDPSKVFRLILSDSKSSTVSSIALAHNHPSGNTQPSENDIVLTNRLKQGAEILGLKVIDHLIFTNKDYYSFADEGIL